MVINAVKYASKRTNVHRDLYILIFSGQVYSQKHQRMGDRGRLFYSISRPFIRYGVAVNESQEAKGWGRHPEQDTSDLQAHTDKRGSFSGTDSPNSKIFDWGRKSV